jgi:hypothetical protein
MYLLATSMVYEQLIHIILLKFLDFASKAAITTLDIFPCPKQVLCSSQFYSLHFSCVY